MIYLTINKYFFWLPDLFKLDFNNQKLSKYEDLIKVEFIKTFSSRDIERAFYTREFFNTYNISEGFIIYEKVSI